MAKLPGRKIDTIRVAVDGGVIEAEMRLLTEGGVASFYAVCPALGLESSGENIDQVRKQITQLLKESGKIEWKLYYLLRVTTGRDPLQEMSPRTSIEQHYDLKNKPFDFRLGVELVETAKLPDGKMIHLFSPTREAYGRGRNRRPTNVEEGMPEVGKIDSFRDQEQRVVAMLDATPENWQRIQAIFASAARAGEMLATSLMPGNTEKTFEQKNRTGLHDRLGCQSGAEESEAEKMNEVSKVIERTRIVKTLLDAAEKIKEGRELLTSITALAGDRDRTGIVPPESLKRIQRLRLSLYADEVTQYDERSHVLTGGDGIAFSFIEDVEAIYREANKA